jgi:hypothetical protein
MHLGKSMGCAALLILNQTIALPYKAKMHPTSVLTMFQHERQSSVNDLASHTLDNLLAVTHR